MERSSTFTCVNCQLHFEVQTLYREHYKSEHHRYNVKRKLISLPPLSYPDYLLQFQTELSSKSQSQSEIYCEVCSKKFMSPQTYKQHINSQKHKNNRKQLLAHAHQDKSESSSMSEFEVIGQEEHARTLCPFCTHSASEQHMRSAHCFPPFREECTDLKGLIQCVEAIVHQGRCVYCDSHFATADSAKQHMADSGHSHLDLENFAPYEPYYLWKISESDQENEEGFEKGQETESVDILEEQSEFSEIGQVTLQSLEEKRLARIKYGVAGVTINGKEVGYRSYKQYYKQFLGRKIEALPREQKCLPASEEWKLAVQHVQPKPDFVRIMMRISSIMETQPNPTLKGRLLNLERQARQMKSAIASSEAQIGQLISEIQEGTQSTILNDKISFIRDLLGEKLEQIDYKIKKYISEQKEKNHQLVQLIGIVKNEKLRLQDHLSMLEERLEVLRVKIGLPQGQF